MTSQENISIHATKSFLICSFVLEDRETRQKQIWLPIFRNRYEEVIFLVVDGNVVCSSNTNILLCQENNCLT